MTTAHHRSLNWSHIRTAEPVLQAMAECNRLGREAFLQRYDCAPSTKYVVHYQTHHYDLKALAAATWTYAFPQEKPLTGHEFSGGEALVKLFSRLGFTVITRKEAIPGLFQVGETYTREDIFTKLAIPLDKRPPDLLAHGPDWYLFATVGTPGRTGHDYGNHWDGPELVWQGKNRSHLNQQTIKSLIHPEGVVHVFTREQDRSPFVYQGIGEAIAYEDTSPVTIRWRFNPAPPLAAKPLDMATAVGHLHQHIQQQGFCYQPWQIASFITALRTKPFVILAGVSGTGKSKLPKLIGHFTGSTTHLIPVRPDWTDSAELLGYQNLQDTFVSGPLLDLARNAQAHPEQTFICILDEMNLARVEQYLAEVLSLIEDRTSTGQPTPLNPHVPTVFFPPNLKIVGTVNMDETTHGFARKVLDRAFVLEMSDVDLSQWQSLGTALLAPQVWPASIWQPLAARLAELKGLSVTETNLIHNTIQLLQTLNPLLAPAQLQVGYRVRDEICLYLLHAQPLHAHFKTAQGAFVDPLDLALLMKVLPRIQGSGHVIQDVLLGLLNWNQVNTPPDDLLRQWQQAARPLLWPTARFPHTTARLLAMWERYQSEGFTSYWL